MVRRIILNFLLYSPHKNIDNSDISTNISSEIWTTIISTDIAIFNLGYLACQLDTRRKGMGEMGRTNAQ